MENCLHIKKKKHASSFLLISYFFNNTISWKHGMLEQGLKSDIVQHLVKMMGRIAYMYL